MGPRGRVPVEEVVRATSCCSRPGEQIVADGRVLGASELRLDESILSGESEPARRAVGEEVRSGAFVVEGTGVCEVTAVGADSFAERLTGQARSFRHPRSPLERAINRLLYALVALVVGLGALLGYSLYHRHVPVHTAVATSAAGVVSLIPEGLMVLVSLTYAVAAVRMSRRGVLAQQLNAIESLASVDTICVDKTGTLTRGGAAGRRGSARAGHRRRELAGGARGRSRRAPPHATSPCGRSPMPFPRSPGHRLARSRSRAGGAGARSRCASRRSCIWVRRSACRSASLRRARGSASTEGDACSLLARGASRCRRRRASCRRRTWNRLVWLFSPRSCAGTWGRRSRSCVARGSR